MDLAPAAGEGNVNLAETPLADANFYVVTDIVPADAGRVRRRNDLVFRSGARFRHEPGKGVFDLLGTLFYLRLTRAVSADTFAPLAEINVGGPAGNTVSLSSSTAKVSNSGALLHLPEETTTTSLLSSL